MIAPLWNRYSDRRILEFQDFIPGAWLRQLLVNSRDEISGWIMRRRRGPHFAFSEFRDEISGWIMEEEAWAALSKACGIKSREGHSLVPHSLIA
ncbi:hypothetical protein OIU74_025045, partial [Salix koriyanagi]